ncbi:MAG: leucyl/phenylalanyl-tRNA--protein transferase [Candidatus Kapaibacterium sp.]
MSNLQDILHPTLIVEAYREGFFPMAESKEGPIYWHSPDPRAIIPLQNVRRPRSLRQLIKKNPFEYRVDYAFEEVIHRCAEREDTWISSDIIHNYLELFRMGLTHSVEAWQDGRMVGGLYGVAIGGAFFGESMFTDVSNASKAAFYVLTDILKQNNFILLDSQYINAHTRLLGAIEIPRSLYLVLLKKALYLPVTFEY